MFDSLFLQFAQLAGVAAVIAAVVSVVKNFGLPDGYAPKVSAALSLLAFLGMAYLKLFRPDVDILSLDANAAEISKLILYLLGFAVQVGLPAQFYKMFKAGGVPLLGFSHPEN